MRSFLLLESRYSRILYLLLATPTVLLVGIVLGRLLLPWVQAAGIFPLYFYTLSRGWWKETSFLMALWAALVATLIGLLSFYQPGFMETRILHAGAYRIEMFHWISTGIGPEGDIRQFLPQHALHFLFFAILTVVSGGFLGLVMGSSLMNYMSYYVGTLLLEADSVIAVAILAWPPWAVLRVAGFILLAMVLSMLLFRRFLPPGSQERQMKFYGFLGLTLLILDVVLKWKLAAIWQRLLQTLTHL